MSALSAYIQQELDKRGWDQTTLADKSGVIKSTISRIMSGRVLEPELSTLDCFARTFGVPLGVLVDRVVLDLTGREPEPSDRDPDERASALVASMPWLLAILDDLARMEPHDRDALLAFLEAQKQIRGRRTS